MKTPVKYCFLLSLITFYFVPCITSSQNLWVGGFPGAETEWQNPRNWSQNQVPDWTQHVVIPDVSTRSGYYPVIDSRAEDIPSLEIRSGATLEVAPDGRLLVDGAGTYNYGVLLVGKVYVYGQLEIVNTALSPIEGNLENWVRDDIIASAKVLD